MAQRIQVRQVTRKMNHFLHYFKRQVVNLCVQLVFPSFLSSCKKKTIFIEFLYVLKITFTSFSRTALINKLIFYLQPEKIINALSFQWMKKMFRITLHSTGPTQHFVFFTLLLRVEQQQNNFKGKSTVFYVFFVSYDKKWDIIMNNLCIIVFKVTFFVGKILILSFCDSNILFNDYTIFNCVQVFSTTYS